MQFHELLLVRPTDAVAEVSGYFCESWGNRARIDYGSGMELNFLCWLCVSIHRLPYSGLTDAYIYIVTV